MNINWITLLKLVLPTSLRNGLTELVKATASQLTLLYSDFQAWQIDIRLQAAMTCQVMYLELMLNYRLLNTFTRTIYITDGDGIIVDFFINIPDGVQVDANRMIGLIDKYKTFGKRYTIGQSQYTYAVNWSDFVCEKNAITYEGNWSDFVCEKIGSPTNFFTPHYTTNSVQVLSEYAVGVNVAILMSIIYTDNTQQEGVYVYMQAGSSYSNVQSTTSGKIVKEAFIRSLSPQSDANHQFMY